MYLGLAVGLPAVLAGAPARVDLQDEVQVYDDAINTPGETGLELHANTTSARALTAGR